MFTAQSYTFLRMELYSVGYIYYKLYSIGYINYIVELNYIPSLLRGYRIVALKLKCRSVVKYVNVLWQADVISKQEYYNQDCKGQQQTFLPIYLQIYLCSHIDQIVTF